MSHAQKSISLDSTGVGVTLINKAVNIQEDKATFDFF